MAHDRQHVNMVPNFASVARGRWPAGIPTLLWILLPVSILSLGTSKLLHYAYPFVAPIGLFGGYCLAVAGHRIVTIPEGVAVSPSTRRVVRIVLAAALVGSVILLLVTAGAADHRLAYEVGPLVIRNASVMRPLVFVLLILMALTGRYRTALGALDDLPIPWGSPLTPKACCTSRS